MKIALVLTVKNEERILRSNLAYHRALGAEHIFVYFDDTTDNGKESIKDFDYVTVQNSVSITLFENNPSLEKFTSKASEHHTARQCLNTMHALKECEHRGYDWLISIDADELICTSKNTIELLPDFFSKIPKEIDVVTFKTLEVFAREMHYNNVFSEETLFKTQPFYGNRFKNCYKKIYNPFTKSTETYSYWLGQHLGKAAIRAHRNVISKNVHRYRKTDGSALQKIEKGNVLHYHAYDSLDFIKKFTNFSNRPNTFLSGNSVNSLKLLLRDVVNNAGYSQKELKEYFKAYLLTSPKDINQLKKNRYFLFFKRKPAPITIVTSVQQVFKKIANI